MTRIHLVLYSRPGCHLCQEMVSQLLNLQAELNFGLQVEDVDRDPSWQQAYGLRVPVLLLDEVEIAEVRLDESKFRQQLQDLA